MAISQWPFDDAFVPRILRNDILQLGWHGYCQMWVYHDPEGHPVGFGTLDISDTWDVFTAGQRHPYIPLLALRPKIESRGYGTSIVQHLVAQAAIFAAAGVCADTLFLDVYEKSERAIRLYNKCEFVRFDDTIRRDPDEEDEPYFVMAKSVAIAPG